MPVVIENISPERDPSEAHDYRVSINGAEVAVFQHYREYGLADCLSIAASAVRRALADREGGE